MERTKFDYGIDLGTTNSSIARMENGSPKIIRTDQNKDIMPSCVSFNKKKIILVGDPAESQFRSDKLKALTSKTIPNAFIEFKRTMGTDKHFHSHLMDQDYDSEQLSAEVLKKLRSFINDEVLKSVIITVPAKFDISQKDATHRAAKLAGFQQVELLQEPIAASLAYGLNSINKTGYWVVFDFGGGTFDAALVKSDEGIMKVVDTDGDNHLGGKDLDYAIVKEILIPHLKRHFNINSFMQDEKPTSILNDALKQFAEEIKNQLSFNHTHSLYYEDSYFNNWKDDDGLEIELDLTIKRTELKTVIGPLFQRAIDITKELLERNNLPGEKLDSLILVGGPTHSPILREMLEKQIKKPDTSADPMTAIAIGAAIYASTVDLPGTAIDEGRIAGKIQLDIGYAATTVETEEMVTVKTLPGKTTGKIPDKVFVELTRGDKAWSSGKVEINDKGEIIDVLLNENKPNNFEVVLYDEKGNRLDGQPDNFTIICGIDGRDAAILNHGIGIEIDSGKPYPVFEPVKGLEKNVPIPATGTINGLKTKTDIRPGTSDDRIRISLYQGEYDSKGSRAIFNKLIYDVIITGDNLPGMLPANSDVDLTISTDRSSGRIEKLEAYFPYLDYTYEVKIPENPPSSISPERLDEELDRAEATIARLKSNSLIDQEKLNELEKEITYQRERFDQAPSEIERRIEVFGNLNRALRKAEQLEAQHEWESLEIELRGEFERLENAESELGNEKTNKELEEIRSQVDVVIRKKDIETGKKLLEKINDMYWSLTFIYQLVGFVQYHSEYFGSVEWKDATRARRLLSQAEDMIADNPTVRDLHPLVIKIYDLIIESGQEMPADILQYAGR